MDQQYSDDNNQQNNQSAENDRVGNSSGPVDTSVKQRSAVRQRLALALMAVDGVLVAAVLWFELNGHK